MVDLSHEFIRQIESEKVAYNFSVEIYYLRKKKLKNNKRVRVIVLALYYWDFTMPYSHLLLLYFFLYLCMKYINIPLIINQIKI